MNGTPLPPKKEVALALLERESVHVHLDPRAAGVVVPAWFKRQPQLVLQVGLNMPVPIPDLRVDDDGMSCTLSFNRSPFFCIVPWSSVYAMVGDDGRGMVWPEDVPPEVALQARSREAEPAAKPQPPKRALAAVKTPAEPPRRATGKPAAKTRAVRSAPLADKTAKKPRTRKSTPATTSSATGRSPRESTGAQNGRGVLVSIPSGSAEPPPPSPAATRPASTPLARPTRELRDESRPKASPSAKPSPAPIASSPPAHAPAASMPTRKPGGKTKREIPPYLRVVK